MTNKQKLKFYREYIGASNAASGSKYDSNANITQKNIATLSYEMPKLDNISFNNYVMREYITKYFGKNLGKQYRQDLANHIIYRHDNTSGSGGFPYCCSISLYPFLLDGLKKLGAESGPPKHANSFIGGLINLIFLVAGQFVGAVAIPEFLTYFDHFLRVDYGNDYIDHLDDTVEINGHCTHTLKQMIEDWFQQLIFTINAPASARGYQSVFINIAYFDQYYFKSIFKDFVFPDGDEPNWETTKELQKMFMRWFNSERDNSVLTFPVESFNILVEDGKYKDEEMADFAAEMWEKKASFFMYQSDSVDSLSSCCFEGTELISVRDIASKEITTLPISEFCIKHSEDCSKYEIISYNAESDSLEYSKITGTLIKKNEYPNLIKIEAEDGTLLKVTPEHTLLVEEIATKKKLEIKAKDLVNNFEKYDLIKNN